MTKLETIKQLTNENEELKDVLREAHKEIMACYKRLNWGIENETNVIIKIKDVLKIRVIDGTLERS